jgi:hypothetical protein
MQFWLLGTFLYFLGTQVIAVLARLVTTGPSLMGLLSTYCYLLLPFAFTWTTLGSIWYATVSDGCLPEAFSRRILMTILVICFIYVVVGLLFCALFSVLLCMWNTNFIQIQLTEPLVEQTSRPLPAALFSRLGSFTHEFTGREEGTCFICYEEFCVSVIQNASLITDLPCGHLMHADCLHNWMQVKAVCPLCRADVVRMLQGAE